MDFVDKAFSQASETSKLLITLATALVAFCATVVNVKSSETTLLTPTTSTQKLLLLVSLIMMLANVSIGVWTHLAITTVLSEGTAEKPSSPWDRRITFPFQTQLVSFVLAVAVLALYAGVRMFG